MAQGGSEVLRAHSEHTSRSPEVLGLTVVAEGVESEAVWAWLADQGCDEAQGRLISMPVPGDAFERLLSDRGLVARSLGPAVARDAGSRPVPLTTRGRGRVRSVDARGRIA